MRAQLSILLAVGLLVGLLGATVQADTIVRSKSNIENVEVFNETYEVVEYYPPGIRIAQKQAQKEVIKVEYDNWPESWEIGHENLANSAFEQAYQDFLDVSRANAEDFPQARQYGMFWAAETLRKAGEAGNTGAIQQALADYDKLLQAKPDTVHFFKVAIGKGRCFLMLKKQAQALAEFEKVLNAEVAKPDDKVNARVAKAMVSEMEGRYRNALNEYEQILDDAQRYAPDSVPLVKVRIASCKVGLEQFEDALAEFNRILSSAKKPEVRAAAYNGRGDCYWKKRDYEKALWDYLHVVVLFETVTSESPKAFYYAAQSMSNVAAELRKEGKKDEERVWRSRSRELIGELRTKFPGSEYANK